MSEMELENTLSLEDPAIAEPTAPEPVVAPPEPVVAAPPAPVEDVEGIKGALIAERRRRQELEAEISTLRQPPPAPKPDIPDVSDDDAERYARRYELYTKDGLDLPRAKQIIADNRQEMRRVAHDAVEQAVGPVKADNFKQAAREQFRRVAYEAVQASQLDGDGLKVFAEKFFNMPAEIAMQPNVAEHVLDATIGALARTRRPKPSPPEREPLLTESPGGPRNPAYTMSHLEKKVAESRGIPTADWEKAAKGYQPGQPNRLD